MCRHLIRTACPCASCRQSKWVSACMHGALASQRVVWCHLQPVVVSVWAVPSPMEAILKNQQINRCACAHSMWEGIPAQNIHCN